MKKIISSALVLAVAGTLAGSSVTQAQPAQPAGADLAITGGIFAGLTGAQVGQEIVFGYTVTNKSASRSADLSVTFTVTNGAAGRRDYICPLVSSHFNINPDIPGCEPGRLPAAKTETAGILVTSKATGTTTVTACASDLSGVPDPVPGNNCKKLSLRIR